MCQSSVLNKGTPNREINPIFNCYQYYSQNRFIQTIGLFVCEILHCCKKKTSLQLSTEGEKRYIMQKRSEGMNLSNI
jgi:hypothetical protein